MNMNGNNSFYQKQEIRHLQKILSKITTRTHISANYPVCIFSYVARVERGSISDLRFCQCSSSLRGSFSGHVRQFLSIAVSFSQNHGRRRRHHHGLHSSHEERGSPCSCGMYSIDSKPHNFKQLLILQKTW